MSSRKWLVLIAVPFVGWVAWQLDKQQRLDRLNRLSGTGEPNSHSTEQGDLSLTERFRKVGPSVAAGSARLVDLTLATLHDHEAWAPITPAWWGVESAARKSAVEELARVVQSIADEPGWTMHVRSRMEGPELGWSDGTSFHPGNGWSEHPIK